MTRADGRPAQRRHPSLPPQRRRDRVPPGPPGRTELGSIRQRAGKVVEAWAVEADFDPSTLASNTFAMEWPPRSGKQQEFPEVDRAEWFGLERARSKILPAQAALLDRLLEHLGLPVS